MIPALSALGSLAPQALGGAATVTTPGVTPLTSATPPADFGSMLAQVAQDAVTNLKGAEATSISGLQGHASVQQVVQSVMDAQSSLQTVIAVRDKVVSAYQELSRMAI